MNNQTKITELRQKIDATLKPLIDRPFFSPGIGYHKNLGDTLIWCGADDFFKKNGLVCRGQHSFGSWSSRRLTKDDAIVIMGGGFFGDLYPNALSRIVELARSHRDNRIVMLPQSAWFGNVELMKNAADELRKHNDIHLCFRDMYSYSLAQEHFAGCNVYLVPDMAFYIDPSKLQKWRHSDDFASDKKLYFKRTDPELVEDTVVEVDSSWDVDDWISLNDRSFKTRLAMFLNYRLSHGIGHGAMADALFWPLCDFAARSALRNRYVAIGSAQLAPYGRIVTTRLHALILSVLLNIPVEYIDNISGKLSAFVNTWLSDLSTVKKYD